MDVLTLLKSKNRCLEKFLSLSEDYLSTVGPELDDLSPFQERRDSTLKALELYDRKIADVVAGLGPFDRTPELVASVKRELSRKDDLVHRILAIDLKIIGLIEKAKTDLIQEMAASRKSQEMLGKFKSTWVNEAGTELDEKL
jgi:hypothetical protein